MVDYYFKITGASNALLNGSYYLGDNDYFYNKDNSVWLIFEVDESSVSLHLNNSNIENDSYSYLSSTTDTIPTTFELINDFDGTTKLYVHKLPLDEKVKFIEVTESVFNASLAGDTTKLIIEDNALYFVKKLDAKGNFVSGQLFKGETPYSSDASQSYVSKEGKNSSAIGTLNFTNSWVGVNPKSDGTVDIEFPFNIDKMISSKYNGTGGTTTPSVASIAKNNTVGTANTYQTRYVALPGTGENYSLDSTWSTTADRSVLNKGVTSLVYSTAAAFWIPDLKTSFKITLTKGDGTTVVEETDKIIGGATYSTPNCTVLISDWSDDFMGYKAKATITINIASMLGGAGKFKVRLSHIQGSTEYYKEQDGLFYDDNPAAGSITSGSIALNESSLPTIDSGYKWLSGSKYLKSGTKVDVTIHNVNGVFNKSFINAVGSIYTNCDGVDKDNKQVPTAYTASDVATAAGVTLATAKNTTNASSLTKTISIASNKYLSKLTFQKATCGNGWNTSTLSTASSTDLTIPVDTYAAASTNTNEAFQDENYRLNSDLSTKWVSTDKLGDTDLKVGEGTYLINTTSGTAQYYYRNFGGTQSSGVGIFTLTGDNITETNFVDNDYFDIHISLDGSTWYSVKKLSTESTGIVGVSGIRAQKSTYNLDKTTKQIYYALPPGVTTDTNTGKAGNITSYGIFVKIRVSNSTVKLNNISIEFK